MNLTRPWQRTSRDAAICSELELGSVLLPIPRPAARGDGEFGEPFRISALRNTKNIKQTIEKTMAHERQKQNPPASQLQRLQRQ